MRFRLWLVPSLDVKNEIQTVKDERSTHIHPTKGETSADKLVLAEFAFGTLAGVISFVTAVFTTVVAVPGPWRSFWLTICIASFVCATGLIADGARNFGGRK
jgi:hypothetical protein